MQEMRVNSPCTGQKVPGEPEDQRQKMQLCVNFQRETDGISIMNTK